MKVQISRPSRVSIKYLSDWEAEEKGQWTGIEKDSEIQGSVELPDKMGTQFNINFR